MGEIIGVLGYEEVDFEYWEIQNRSQNHQTVWRYRDMKVHWQFDRQVPHISDRFWDNKNTHALEALYKSSTRVASDGFHPCALLRLTYEMFACTVGFFF